MGGGSFGVVILFRRAFGGDELEAYERPYDMILSDLMAIISFSRRDKRPIMRHDVCCMHHLAVLRDVSGIANHLLVKCAIF